MAPVVFFFTFHRTQLPHFHHSIGFFKIYFVRSQCFDGGPPILLKEEPEDNGMRSIQKVPSLSDLSDPEASLGKYTMSNIVDPLS